MLRWRNISTSKMLNCWLWAFIHVLLMLDVTSSAQLLPGYKYNRHWPRPPCDIEEVCQPRQPHYIQSLKHLRATLSHPWWCFATGNFLTTSMTSAKVMDESSPKSEDLGEGGNVSRIEEIVKGLLPPPNNIFSLGQQFSTQVKHSLRRSLLSLSESLNGLPEHPWGQLKVLLHSFPRFLPHLRLSLAESDELQPIFAWKD